MLHISENKSGTYMNITRTIAYPELEPTDMRRNLDYQFYFNCLGKFMASVINVTAVYKLSYSDLFLGEDCIEKEYTLFLIPMSGLNICKKDAIKNYIRPTKRVY